MNPMISILKVSCCLLMLVVLASCASFPLLDTGGIRRMADGRLVSFQEMIGELKNDRLIFVGELHDDRTHHALQLEVIKALRAAGKQVAIGIEMFSWPSQQALNAWVAREIDLLDFMQVYRQNWTISWEQYDTIFLYARNHGIPMRGLNVPQEIARKVYRSGFASLTEAEKSLLPPGITCRIDTPYMKFVRDMYFGHGMGGSSFEHFCEAQSVRNQTMAWLAVEYLTKNPERVMVVVTGVGHAMKRGVPEEVSQLTTMPYKVVLPMLSPEAMRNLKRGDADYVVAY
ncbi:ChaN family lipoprotein [Geobacter sp. DSM 9736]|uniref:ChaN family lipoprotein n=1 Tax=Geobacter sp. DSM 9736 TaxID=1277350 RepID=UPI000B5F79E7|nr:ChaN family lipoprotein [Geobacter sp. DSM 9736]SNB46516.1 Uncharacterized iron-regulated protein [Geobacter sp. DSM 9736]